MALQSTDPIADLITRIRNAELAGKAELSVPASKMKQRILDVLQQANYIADYSLDETTKPAALKITLNHNITEIVRMSKPGRRMYASADEIPRVKNGRGIVVISTSKGVMTGDEAKKARLGGELLIKVY